jgi:16S rRNA (adenine1518-N6/adenine1519-N6)-dimethyltransferase
MGFQTRRKMLRNNLQTIVERDRLSAILEQIEANPQARAEELSVSQWVALSRVLSPASSALDSN